MTFAQPRRVNFPSSARSPRLAILRPDSDLLRLLDADHTKERSYSQPCRDWPEAKSHLAILLAPAEQQGGEGGEEQPERIWGLGVVRPAHETDRDRKVIVTRARRLQGLVPVSGLWCAGGERDVALFKSLPESGPVTVGADTVFANLRQISPDAEAEVQRLMPLLDESEGWSEGELRWRDERDALLLFAKISGMATPDDFSAVRLWDRTAARAAFIRGLVGTAVQPMLDDIRGRAATRFSGIGETVVRAFASRGGNRSYDFEATSITDRWVVDGGEGSLDAYYYHVGTGTLVMLRYVRPGPNGLFSPDARHGLDEFHSRVHRLPRRDRRTADDYSLLYDPLFLRIHEQVPFTAALHRTSPGAIYPYDQVAAAISAAAEPGLPGPSAGALTRHLVPTHFAQLVRDGWFGASGVPFEAALDWVEATIETAGVALVVVDFSLRQRGNGSGI
ncbi:hypothetical protein [Streptomyces rhizosphaerihabitans]|uniref:hypothetical protein n=1 Tax=Streptomyces rhizosphaerihabitans TaxID=1266770 RepID=UPI0021BF4CF1|nr:hypothetical protein [Streptomyces rhizosphaerihabitans]MCT9010088.1 hypothetical protein [Streptomyces rhizosphaerihabitans]